MLLGQKPRRTLHEGDRVRITAQPDTGVFYETRVYVVRGSSGDTLAVQRPSSAAISYLPMAALRRVEVSRGPGSRAERALWHSLFGALGGGAMGASMGYAMGNDPPGDIVLTRREKAAFLGVAGGAVGLIGGCVIGLLTSGERWERVSLPPRVSATARGNGVLALSYDF
jgi:hypothetical protein